LQSTVVCCSVSHCFGTDTDSQGSRSVCVLLSDRGVPVPVCCSVLQCFAECWNVLQRVLLSDRGVPVAVFCGVCSVLPCIAVCCSVLQCAAVCCSVLHCFGTDTDSERSRSGCILQSNTGVPVAVCCSVLQCVAVCCSVLQCVAVCCSLLQCVAAYCSVLQCAALSWHWHWFSGIPLGVCFAER